MSDGGQIHNPWPHEGLRIFAQSLYEKGITQNELETMMVANPKQLMGL
jgi:predicted metal-dependent phosphotriesterase family hydrolase